jgi:hypothetical protein
MNSQTRVAQRYLKEARGASVYVLLSKGSKANTLSATFSFEVLGSYGRFTMVKDNFKHYHKQWKDILAKSKQRPVVNSISSREMTLAMEFDKAKGAKVAE